MCICIFVEEADAVYVSVCVEHNIYGIESCYLELFSKKHDPEILYGFACSNSLFNLKIHLFLSLFLCIEKCIAKILCLAEDKGHKRDKFSD